MTGTDSTSVQLNSISKRLTEIERRLDALEQGRNPTSRAKDLRPEPRPKPTARKPATSTIKYNYLKKTIDDARRSYEKEQR